MTHGQLHAVAEEDTTTKYTQNKSRIIDTIGEAADNQQNPSDQNGLNQQTVGASSLNVFLKNRLASLRTTRMGFFMD